MRNLRRFHLTSLSSVYNICRNTLPARKYTARDACDKSIAFSFVHSCGRKRMIGQMRMEITGAKSRQEKMRALEADKYFISEWKSKRIGELFRYITSFDFFFYRSFGLLA